MPIFSPGGSLLLPLQTLLAGYTFDRLDYSGSIDERFSTQLRDQLPDFIIENYPLFESFLRAYFEWTELYGNTRSEAVRLETYKDVDETLDQFLNYFRTTFLTNLPRELANGINEKSLIKNIGYLYRSKGTKASFDLLFRILFNTTVDVDYPKDRILKPSTSTFDDRKFLRVLTPLSIEQMKEMESTVIIQRTPQNQRVIATALVDSVKFVSKGGIDYYSLTLQTVSGDFDSNLKITMSPRGSSGGGINAKILPTLTSVQINAGGSGYQLGDELIVRDIYNNELLHGYVDALGPSNQIRGFNYTNNYGVYTNNSGFTYSITTVGGVGASLSAKSESVVADGPDVYFDDSGKLSGRSFVQDSFFYQDFSYVITVNKALQTFSDVVRNLIHPAGTQLFARYKNEIDFDEITIVTEGQTETFTFERMADQSTSNLSFFLPVIGHYLPHTFGTTIDPRGFTYETGSGATHYDFYPQGYNGQDGRTASDFYSTNLSSTDYGTPHVNPVNGITHDPYLVKIPTGLTAFDGVETSRTLVNGAIGSTGYIGATVDSEDEGVGLFGFFPVGSSRSNTIGVGKAFGDGITHYGGYTGPKTTGFTVGISGGQIIQVKGTDSATADYWIVYRHINSLELSGVTQVGTHSVIEIPLLPVLQTSTSITASHGDRTGYSRTIQDSGVSLNGGATFTVGEIVRQRRYNEPEAIGKVLGFRASSYQQNLPDGSSGPDGLLGTPYWNTGIDRLTVEVLNGTFTPFEDSTGTQRPVVGDDNGCARLISGTLNPNKYSSITHEVDWTNIPISLVVNEIPYSVYE